ncbi:CheY-like chemotaxis protein [Flavobacterium gossypii]|uniref:CheY-like chemotaxis protein n=1 Tax=Flavobacterium gossypii TaxID=1646119 RepID=A0ABR6DRC0_9FLAO|nr:response regulator [Flavobacterium gossypii]MBA9074231.1 CheY-like chemotaxis protein [Flavobacterium gossypii]
MEKLKIYLADDDKDDREIFQEAFNEINSGNDLRIFNNGLEVIDFLNANDEIPDIIFLDLNMPLMSGIETLRIIRGNERYGSLSVVIYSTSSSERDIEDTLSAGANIYINKPNNYRALKETIMKVMKIDWQFRTSELDRENFMFAL